MPDLLKKDLENQKALVLDGAMATELEKRGVNTDSQLWSAAALINHPQAVKDVHRSYFEAGADVAITNTYQANLDSFQQIGFTPRQASKMVTNAVKLAQEVRTEFYSNLSTQERQKRAKYPLIAGSVGPFGAYLADGSEYTGDYDLSEGEYLEFHEPRMRLLDAAGIDLFAFETQPNFEEAKTIANLLETKFANRTGWLSFSIKDAKHLCDGTPLEEAVAYFNDYPQITAIGVNCTRMENIEEAVKTIRSVTEKPIVVYPNNGDIYNPETKKWKPDPSSQSFSDLAPKWLNAGATIIGGCCRTTPNDIREVRDALN